MLLRPCSSLIARSARKHSSTPTVSDTRGKGSGSRRRFLGIWHFTQGRIVVMGTGSHGIGSGREGELRFSSISTNIELKMDN